MNLRGPYIAKLDLNELNSVSISSSDAYGEFDAGVQHSGRGYCRRICVVGIGRCIQ